ncbi:MAG: molybdopterin-dependent oxidoreductase [candidate division Zixibacteria bacterium]|nr:molybdopterin-dependent oxidoreductase [candidate division Zixibacteria bacterium]
MPKITIDDRPIEVASGTTIIQAADTLGLFIPHYCYHPGLPVAGSCRMCLVEVEKAPKLQIACYTFVTDVMVVRTTTPQVATARAAILEFLLANHPLDCPVCDQAGECKLQEFYMQFGRYDSTLLEDKTKKHKQLPVGPHIMLDSERCILCSRCTRFVDDITHTHELGIFNRGVHSELLPVDGAAVDNAYSGCLADVCPVGALTDRDFRFKVRVWYLDKTDSVCHGCARGCNIEIHTNRRRNHHNDGKLIARYKPRFNAQVNGYWMCDAGRYSYKQIESPDRFLQPRVRGADGRVQVCDWSTALAAVDESVTRAIAAHGVSSAAVIATPDLSNEELWAVRRLCRDGMKIPTVACRCPADPRGVEDNLLRKADTFPNSFGAQRILEATTESELTVASVLQAAASGRIRLLFVLGGGLTERVDPAHLQQALAQVDLVVAIQSHHSILTDLATMALPASTYAETEGTITNFTGQVQRYWPAIPPLEESKPLLDILAQLANRWELPFTPREPELCFAELAGQVEYFAGLSYRVLGWEGVNPSQRTTSKSTA